jgi:hypothetical protein
MKPQRLHRFQQQHNHYKKVWKWYERVKNICWIFYMKQIRNMPSIKCTQSGMEHTKTGVHQSNTAITK